MDKQEAKLVLQALHPSDLDTAEPTIAEALAFVESDPELRSWWENQQAFDRAVTAKLKEVPMPEDLRASILAGRKIEQFRPQHFKFSFWLAAAAAVAVFCALGTSQYIRNYGPIPRGEYTAAILPLLNHDSPSLAMASTDRDKITAWLKEHDAPTGTLPEKMTALPTLGCQKYMVHGHAVTLICFTLSDGGEAHLFVVEQDAMTDPPSTKGPEMGEVDGWSTAAWSDGKMSYVLATQCGQDALKKLL